MLKFLQEKQLQSLMCISDKIAPKVRKLLEKIHYDFSLSIDDFRKVIPKSHTSTQSNNDYLERLVHQKAALAYLDFF